MKCNHNTIVMRMSKHQEENFERAKKLKDEGKLVEIGNMLVDHVESQMSKVKYLESICGITDFMNLQIELYHRFINPNLQTCKWEQLSGSELLGWADVARFFIARGGKYPLEPVLLKRELKWNVIILYIADFVVHDLKKII